MDNLKDNPFAALFPSLEQAENFTTSGNGQGITLQALQDLPTLATEDNSLKDAQENLQNLITSVLPESNVKIESLAKMKVNENQLIEEIFLITIDNDSSTSNGRPEHLVFLEELYSSLDNQNWLDSTCLEQAVFERLMLPDPKQYLLKFSNTKLNLKVDEIAGESRIICYLYQCFCRWKEAQRKYQELPNAILAKCLNVIVSNAQLALAHPIIFPDSSTHKQLLDLVIENGVDDISLRKFLDATVEAIEIAHVKEQELSVLETFSLMLDHIMREIDTMSITDPRVPMYIRGLQFYTIRTSLALAFFAYNTPQKVNNGKVYEATLLGSILALSPIPKSDQGPFEYFDTPSRFAPAEQENTERSLWTPLNRISTELHRVLYKMIKLSPEVKHKILTWIGSCLRENSARAKIWNSHMGGMLNFTNVSDGFMLNLGSLLLRLCQPFSAPNSPKLTLIDPTYCAAKNDQDQSSDGKSAHLKGMDQETCLIPVEEGINRPCRRSYNFATECFFMCHRSLQLGFHVLHERITKLITELRRLQRVYHDGLSESGDPLGLAETPEALQNIKNAIERGTTIYLCSKTHMMEPEAIEMMLQFHVATSVWLVNVAMNDDNSVFHPIAFPLPNKIPLNLTCIPEFLVDNVADFMSFMRRFNQRYLEMAGESLHDILTLILAFMGSPERMKNPHLRAKLAEALESIMPHPEEGSSPMGILSTYKREELFRNHKHIDHLASVLLHVFVSIEMTGQSVAFEQKFNYRRPMYEVLAYIWAQDVHRKSLHRLADEAIKNIEDANPPLFLRFINLLINDAIYLLDEGLLYMSNLREHQRRRETEEYRLLPVEQRQEAENTFRHTGMLARFHNVMGKQTIKSLCLLTSDALAIFVHPTLVDRIAAMLNYFLLNLVGPKNRALKVRDMDEYEFKPQDLVSGICEIYINLGQCPEFWEAVATDGRSYSNDLFVKAADVLCRIGKGALVSGFQEVADHVKETAEKLKVQEEAFMDAPDDFLDPIMGTLMRDPVMLPSSRMTVDRSTIARHLLSDQSDPFNRSSLTMDMIEANVELKDRIDRWLNNGRR